MWTESGRWMLVWVRLKPIEHVHAQTATMSEVNNTSLLICDITSERSSRERELAKVPEQDGSSFGGSKASKAIHLETALSSRKKKEKGDTHICLCSSISILS